MTELARLLEKWAEREVVRVNGRGLRLPEFRYKWGFNRIGGLAIIAKGYCTERCTQPHEHDDVDEFGWAVKSLTPDEQALVIVGHFGDREEWLDLLKTMNLSTRQARVNLRCACEKLLKDWDRRKRELEALKATS